MVAQHLDPGFLDLLLAISVTEQICGSLASALTGEQHGQELLENIERRDLFLRRTDETGVWFRFHDLFAQFLGERLERHHPELLPHLHGLAAEWFAEHHMLSEAIDHAMVAGRPERAVELVEANARELLEHSQLATLTELAGKLDPAHASTHANLQITLAWAAVLARRHHELQTALHLAVAADERANPAREQPSDLLVEAALIRGVESALADRLGGLDEWLREVRSRADSLDPWTLCTASSLGAFVALHRFEFDVAREWHDWATPYFQQISGALSVMYSRCVAGMAAREQLDMTRAESHFRAALRLARSASGEHSFSARLASSMLGEFLYERDDLEAADRLLDTSAELGFEGGPVDFLLATYGTGARVKAVRGEFMDAAQRLDVGDQGARSLGLPRLAARIAIERVRWGLDPVPPESNPPEPIPADSEIAVETGELEQQAAIRWLLRRHPDIAATKSAELVHSIDADRRPRAALYATLLHAHCLAAAGRAAEARTLLVPALGRCAEAGIVRPILDEGPSLVAVVAQLRTEELPRVPREFLDRLTTASGARNPDPDR